MLSSTLLALAVSGRPVTLDNGVATAVISDAAALLSLRDSGPAAAGLVASDDAWSLNLSIALTPPLNLTLSSSSPNCTSMGLTDHSSLSVSAEWRCTTPIASPRRLPLFFTVTVVYSLRAGAAFVSKVLHVSSSDPFSRTAGGVFTVLAVQPFGSSFALAPSAGSAVPSGYNHANPWGGEVAHFVRWATHGVFVSIANPYSTFSSTVQTNGSLTSMQMTAAYNPVSQTGTRTVVFAHTPLGMIAVAPTPLGMSHRPFGDSP